MPEEINRVLTDRLSRFLFTTSRDANANLKLEGITEGIHFVGNTMIDSLKLFSKLAEKTRSEEKLGLEKNSFALATFHRPENVDELKTLGAVVRMISTAAKFAKVVFPVHPRTLKKLRKTGLKRKLEKAGVLIAKPLGYLEFLNLEGKAKFVLTDSGGVQEETTVLGVPCFTARATTERPVTVWKGTNTIVGLDAKLLEGGLKKLYAAKRRKGRIPEKWDGKAAKRICGILKDFTVKRL